MKKASLGQTGIEVSELCFGVLPMGPLQAGLTLEAGAELIVSALNQGVNFLDTAELYRTYPYIRKALDNYAGEVVIASKSAAETYEGMKKSIEDALEQLNRSFLDLFLIHAARDTAEVFEERRGALKCLKEYKAKGKIRAIGISTHSVEVVLKAAEHDDMEVIFPIINKMGLGIVGGSTDEMLQAIKKGKEAGKGIYAMKALAGGHLIGDVQGAINYVRNIEGICSVAVGMVKKAELDLNLKIFNDEDIPEELLLGGKKNKRLIVSVFCKGCGSCVEACPNRALSLVNGKAEVNPQSCLLCGYCSPSCPEFALRVV